MKNKSPKNKVLRGKAKEITLSSGGKQVTFRDVYFVAMVKRRQNAGAHQDRKKQASKTKARRAVDPDRE